MKTIRIYCKKCKVSLTEELTQVPQETITFPDEANAVPHQKFVFFKHDNVIDLLVARDDHYLKNHPDDFRFYGCCGSDGSNGMNKLCVNGHEVATEFSDCYTSYYIKFDFKKILIKEKSGEGSFKEVRL